MLKKLFTGFIVFIGLFSMTGCTSGSTGGTSNRVQEYKVNVSTVEGRKEAVTKMVDELISIGGKDAPEEKQIQFIKKYNDKSTVDSTDKVMLEMYQTFCIQLNKNNYKYQYVDLTNMLFYIGDYGGKTSESGFWALVSEKDNHIYFEYGKEISTKIAQLSKMQGTVDENTFMKSSTVYIK